MSSGVDSRDFSSQVVDLKGLKNGLITRRSMVRFHSPPPTKQTTYKQKSHPVKGGFIYDGQFRGQFKEDEMANEFWNKIPGLDSVELGGWDAGGMLVAIRCSLRARLEGRMMGGDSEVMRLVDEIENAAFKRGRLAGHNDGRCGLPL